MLFNFTVPSSVLAIATTVHLAMAAVCNHRHARAGAVSLWALPSVALALAPWVFPTALGLAAGFGMQVLWLSAATLIGGPRPISLPPPAPAPPPRARAAREGAPSPFIQVPVLATIDETPDIKTIRVSRPPEFDFEAGQFLTLRVQVDGTPLARCYSISSPPAASGYLEISIKRQGVVSNALHAIAKPGSLLSVRAPNGRFVYPADDRPLLLLAGGVGITPLMSMLRHAVLTEPSRRVTLLYAARTTADFAYRDELMSLARRHPHIRPFFVVSREPAHPSDVYPGRIDETLLRTVVPDLPQSIALMCGPAPMIEGLRELLAGLGVPGNQIRYEVFSPAAAASAIPAVAGTPSGASFDMHCVISSRTVPIGASQTVLDAAEAAGIVVPSLCRAGVCGTCRTRVTSGRVECSSTTLTDAERADGFVLACVATAGSGCTVDL